jgi:D-alanyl-lipoteichoic acid acyltransferase DltB (MBOAT superfamily)
MLNFNSFTFFGNLFPLLLLLLPIYRVVSNVIARRLMVAAAGVYLLGLIAPRLALFYLGFWLIVWIFQWLVAATAEKRRGTLLFALVIVLMLVPMVTWKVFTAPFVIDFNLWSNQVLLDLSSKFGPLDLFRDIIVPLGLSFTTFRGIDLIIKTYLGEFDRLPLDEILFYGFFPPVLLIGPVIQYTDIREAVKPQNGKNVWEDLRSALLLILSGLAKVFLISYPLQKSADMFVYYRTNPTYRLWMELILFALYFFFNFAGYSDLAIGGAKILGFDIQRNFNWPYTKTNPQDFWNSWHMSLTGFFQRNVFVPFGGMRPQTQYRAIFLTIMCIALWHDISIPLVIFGLYQAAGLIGHRWLRGKRPPPNPQPLPLTIAKAAGQFMFFAFSLPLFVLSANQIIPFYTAMVGIR